MNALLEFLPLLGLGAGYFIGKSINPELAMYYLSFGAIIGTLLQFALFKLRREKMQKMTLITGWLLIIFASLTLIFQNPLFVKLKPTVLAWAFALCFWGYAFIKKQSLLEMMMGGQFKMPPQNWLTLNWFWVIFNVLVGAANLFVVSQMSEDAWATFKLVVLPIASLIFIAAQTYYLLKKGTMTANTKAQEPDQRKM